MEILNISNCSISVKETIINSSCQENNTLDIESSDKSTYEVYITKSVFNFGILPFLITVGLFGNVSTLIVFSKGHKNTASITFIIGLALSDLFILVFRLIANILSIGHVYFTEAVRYVRPNSFIWIHLCLAPQRSGNMYILAIVIERFIAVWFPLKVKQIWTTRRVRIVTAAIVTLTLSDMLTYIDAFLFSLNEQIPEEGTMSIPIEAGRYIRQQSKFVATWSFVFRIMFDMVPLPFVFIFNVLTIAGINRKILSLSKESNNEKSKVRKDKEAKSTRMLLAISMLFILLCSPFTLYVNFVIHGVIRDSDVPFFVYQTLEMLYLLNSVINFVIYGVCDRYLREIYLHLWRCRKLDQTKRGTRWTVSAITHTMTK